MERLRKDDSGFTLIELMVVVLVIALLIAIAIPSFIGARKRSMRAQIQSSLRDAALAVEGYATDRSGDYSTLNSATNPDYLIKLQGEGFTMPSYFNRLRIRANSTEFCIEGRHRRLPGSDSWRRAVFQKSVGTPQPMPNSCPGLT